MRRKEWMLRMTGGGRAAARPYRFARHDHSVGPALCSLLGCGGKNHLPQNMKAAKRSQFLRQHWIMQGLVLQVLIDALSRWMRLASFATMGSFWAASI